MINPHSADGLLVLGISLIIPGIIVMVAFFATHSRRPNWSRGRHHRHNRWHLRH